jgi:hypothetical protein
MRRTDQDQTHTFVLLLGYLAERYRVQARMRAASGTPRTEVIGSYQDLVSMRTEPLFGGHNLAENPGFLTLDLHAEADLLRAPVRLTLLADVLNATQHRNVEQRGYTRDFRGRRDVLGLPTLAMLGLRLGY